MILTSGGRFAGYGFYLLQGKPVFLWNLVDLKRVKWESTEVLAPGKHTLVFDFKYDNHRGVIVYVRVVDGEFRKNESLLFAVSSEKFICLEVGTFSPEEEPKDKISTGEIGYIVTGIKKPGIASVGDTITYAKKPALPLPGYMNPKPVVWASVYPESQDDFPNLKQALSRLRLSDSSFSYEEESSGSLGKGFRLGFLGMLHLEIITERLKREFNLNLQLLELKKRDYTKISLF